MAYLVVKAGGQTKSYSVKASANKPYLRVSTGYIPLTTETTTATGLRAKVGGSVCRPIETYTTTISVNTSSTNTYTYNTTRQSAYNTTRQSAYNTTKRSDYNDTFNSTINMSWSYTWSSSGNSKAPVKLDTASHKFARALSGSAVMAGMEVVLNGATSAYSSQTLRMYAALGTTRRVNYYGTVSATGYMGGALNPVYTVGGAYSLSALTTATHGVGCWGVFAFNTKGTYSTSRESQYQTTRESAYQTTRESQYQTNDKTSTSYYTIESTVTSE